MKPDCSFMVASSRVLLASRMRQLRSGKCRATTSLKIVWSRALMRSLAAYARITTTAHLKKSACRNPPAPFAIPAGLQSAAAVAKAIATLAAIA
jgi:hypothetical protein